MRTFITILLLLGIIYTIGFSQSCQDVSVELSATVQADPPRITLNWVANASATGHFVYRKLKAGTSWGAVIGSLSGTATQFVDSTVQKGISYEYRVLRQSNSSTGFGYINAGIEIAPVLDRGVLILVIDKELIAPLSFELNRLTDDLESDGWRVRRRWVDRTDPVTEVKDQIFSQYNLDPINTKAVLLFGRVPVPYSGQINVDGHSDHTGAYPADVYYADMNGVWTDSFVNDTTAGDPRNRNIPEDGKFDQGLLPSDLELEVGRIDFYNMPSFGEGEIELMRKYLNKNHEYRIKKFIVEDRALIDDNFGYFSGEAFAASGWKNFGPLVSPENVVAGDYIPGMTNDSYLWSYGCGGGWYQGAGGVGSTGELANADLQTVFTMLFGSYFGDWDSQDNFLRSALAQGKTLTNVWSGRPHWQFHHMGLGENIGYSTRLSQNNTGLYHANSAAHAVHMALMGDPTLENDIVTPVASVESTSNGQHVTIKWSPLPEAVGYYVYGKLDFAQDFTLVSEEMIQDTFVVDSCIDFSNYYYYMVRAVVLEETPSGTYYNLSQGTRDTVGHLSLTDLEANADYEVTGNSVQFMDNTIGLNYSTLWIFGDGQTSAEKDPIHIFGQGTFEVMLIVFHDCDADTANFTLHFTTAVSAPFENDQYVISPNPSNGSFQISSTHSNHDDFDIEISSMSGEVVFKEKHVREGSDIHPKGLTPGFYIISITKKDRLSIQQLIIY